MCPSCDCCSLSFGGRRWWLLWGPRSPESCLTLFFSFAWSLTWCKYKNMKKFFKDVNEKVAKNLEEMSRFMTFRVMSWRWILFQTSPHTHTRKAILADSSSLNWTFFILYFSITGSNSKLLQRWNWNVSSNWSVRKVWISPLPFAVILELYRS